jgi:hypothetical protein
MPAAPDDRQPRLRDLPNRFDRQQNLVFFPAFPTLGPRCRCSSRAVVWSGTIVSIAAFAWAMRYFFRLARDPWTSAGGRGRGAAGRISVRGLLSAPYTEGLFLLAMLGLWHLRRDERWAGFAWASWPA